jgi:hypothetical protein
LQKKKIFMNWAKLFKFHESSFHVVFLSLK